MCLPEKNQCREIPLMSKIAAKRWFIVGTVSALLAGTWLLSKSHQDKVQECLAAADIVANLMRSHLDNFHCLPGKDAKSNLPFATNWRGELFFLYFPRPIYDKDFETKKVTEPPIQAMVFCLGNPKGDRTNIYAIKGSDSAFSPDHICEIPRMSKETIVFISGALSEYPWHDPQVQEISLQRLKEETGSVRNVVGDTLPGVVFVTFLSGEVWAVESSVPAKVIGSLADATRSSDPQALERLRKFRCAHD